MFHLEFSHLAHVVFLVPFRAGLGLCLLHYRMLREELGWGQQKSDELLLPVIQRVSRRSAAAVANRQSNLDAYFGNPIGRVGGSAVPRKRQAYTSKRLQKVVTDYREEQRKRSKTTAKGDASAPLDSDRSGDDYMEETDGNEDQLDVDVDGSDDHWGRDPTSGSMTRTGKMSKRTTTAKTVAPTKRKTASEKRKVRKSPKSTSTVSSSTKRKKRANDSDDCDYDDEHIDADEVTPVPARPRPKPVRKKANTNFGAASECKTTDQRRDG